MGLYRKRPIIVEAQQWFPGRFVPGVVEEKYQDGDRVYPAYVETPEGRMGVMPGDWIVTGVRGERYPCKPDVFDATYEPAD